LPQLVHLPAHPASARGVESAAHLVAVRPPRRASRRALGLIALGAACFLITAPILGWPPIVRLGALLGVAGILVLAALRVWTWGSSEVEALDRWVPSTRFLWAAAGLAIAVLGWTLLARFWSGELNGIDFTVYFDRPCYQTVRGRPLFIETADDPRFAQQGQLAQHAYWGLFLACAPYALYPSPYWLLALTILAPVAGAFYLLRIARRMGAGGVLGSATALAFLLNDNTARTINYGFHPEVLYAWLIPWMLDAGLRGARVGYLAAALGCILVKEDAVLPVLAVVVTLAIQRWRVMSRAERGVFLLAPVALACLNLAVYYFAVLPRLTTDGPFYVGLWSGYGSTPAEVVGGMLADPLGVLRSVFTSGLWAGVLLPFLFLPLLGWRWTIGILPTVALYSASTDEQVRSFALYYAIALVPFLTLAAATGGLRVATRVLKNPAHARLATAVMLVLSVVLIGGGSRGYSLRAWRPEVGAVAKALPILSAERRVLVQSSLYPHVGYDSRLQLLTPDAIGNPANAGAAVLLAPALGAFPFVSDELATTRGLAPFGQLPGGLVLARLGLPPQSASSVSSRVAPAAP
jgi:uncharacterized membrane protein